MDSSVLNPTAANPPNLSCFEKCYDQLRESYEKNYGGFSGAPKFPHLANLNFLFHIYAREPSSSRGKTALDMCVYTLKMMANGGIHDHIGQVYTEKFSFMKNLDEFKVNKTVNRLVFYHS